MIQIYVDNILAYDSRQPEYDLVGLTVTTGLNKGGSAEITMPPGHPAYNRFVSMASIVEIYRDNRIIFRGRALYPTDDFYNQRKITCEGELCLFQDGISRPYLYRGTPASIFAAVVAEYNAQVEEKKQFQAGTVTVQDPDESTEPAPVTGAVKVKSYLNIRSGPGTNYSSVGQLHNGDKVTITETTITGSTTWGNIGTGWVSLKYVVLDPVPDNNNYMRLEIENAENCLATLNKLLDRCGGYFTFNYAGDGIRTRVINWLESIGSNNNQVIEFGENLLGFSRNGANTSLVTGIIPYGAKDEETGERVTIESVNGGLDYIIAEDARAVRGTIMTSVTWDDVTDPANLLTMAQDYLAENKYLITSLELTALDLSYMDKSLDSFKVGDTILVKSEPHGVNDTFQLTELTEDLLNPANSTVKLGKSMASLTVATVASQTASYGALQSVQLTIKQEYTANTDQAVEAAEERMTSLIQQGADSIDLSVSGTLGGNAAIMLSVGGTVQTQTLDLSNVRQAFAIDNEAVDIGSGAVTFAAGILRLISPGGKTYVLCANADGTVTCSETT